MRAKPPDPRAQAKKAALNALKRAKRAADKSGIALSDWEGEFLTSVTQRVETYGRAFGDPEKGGRDQAPVVLAKGENQFARRIKALGAAHGVGRSDLIESRLVGIKSREVYEAPAAQVLSEAHAELERLVLDRELLHYKQGVALKYAELVYDGLWWTPLKTALDAFVATTQRRVSGWVRLKLLKGRCQVVGRRSPYGLYHKGLATYGKADQFDRQAAEGFIKLWGLPYEGLRKEQFKVRSGKFKATSNFELRT